MLVIITDAWEPQINGVVRTLTTTIEILRQRGMDVRVVEPSLFKGVSTKMLPEMTLSKPPYEMERWLVGAKAIHIATEGPLGIAAKLYCDRHKLPYTTAFHTNFPSYAQANFKIPSRFVYPFFRWFHRKAHAVMVPTPSMISELQANRFTNCVLWGRGVDTTLFHPIEENPRALGDGTLPRPYWLNVGRVSKEKNLDAFLSLDLHGTKFIVGDGPDRERLEGEFPKAQFLGTKQGVELAHCYRDADVFVFPSRFDTFGLVNAEAIASGTPVAGFPVTGPKDIVRDGVTGALDEDLKEACLRALKLSDIHDDFSWDAATDQFCSHLVMIP